MVKSAISLEATFDDKTAIHVACWRIQDLSFVNLLAVMSDYQTRPARMNSC